VSKIKLTDQQLKIVEGYDNAARSEVQQIYDRYRSYKDTFLTGIWSAGKTPDKKFKYDKGELTAVD